MFCNFRIIISGLLLNITDWVKNRKAKHFAVVHEDTPFLVPYV